MSEEQFKIIENILSASDIYPADCSFIKNSIIALQEKNEQLKKQLENNSKVNVADHKYASEIEDKYLIEHNILTEFEKWLEERYKQQTETLNKMEEDNIEKRYVKSRRYLVEECLDKLQELKGGKK